MYLTTTIFGMKVIEVEVIDTGVMIDMTIMLVVSQTVAAITSKKAAGEDDTLY